MSGWLVPRAALTAEQLRAVEMPADRHRVLSGGPGSGKTLVLLHRARHLADTLRVPEGRFLVLVYTNALASFLRASLADLGIPESAVRTFDDWCAGHYERHVSPTRPFRSNGHTPDFAAIRAAVLAEVRAHPRREPLYDFVLVDEGQDLDPGVFETLAAVSAHVTVALDPRQQIYEGGAREAEILPALGIPSRSVALLENWRCSPFVSSLAARFVRGGEEREAFLLQARSTRGEKEKPLLYLASGSGDELHRLAEVARARLLRGERVAVLLPDRRLVQRFASGLHGLGVPVEVPHRYGEDGSPFPALDFASDLVKVMPFHSAKGLTFDSVLLPRLRSADFHSRGEASLRRLLFVGITRATAWVYLATREGDPLPLLVEAGLLSAPPDLVVQSHATHPAHPAAPRARESRPDGLDQVPVLSPDDPLTGWM
ncbi:MAG: AAA family ATPase [Holophagales bacterium]|nr:AAA family ATPase [Holophagales bacterium]